MHDGKYPCPCCGYFTFTEPPPGTSQFCEICFWDDIPIKQHWEHTYFEAICIAQTTFLKEGACSPDYVSIVRKPTSNDRRLENWKPLLERIEIERNSLIHDVTAAFRYVVLGDGVSLHEADVIDGYGSWEERTNARRLDYENSWQGISEAKLTKFHWGPFSFMDAIGKRFYFPAFMMHALKNGVCKDHVLSSIEDLEVEDMTSFTPDQLRVMVRYCLYIEHLSGCVARPDRFVKRVKRTWGTIWSDELLDPYRI